MDPTKAMPMCQTNGEGIPTPESVNSKVSSKRNTCELAVVDDTQTTTIPPVSTSIEACEGISPEKVNDDIKNGKGYNVRDGIDSETASAPATATTATTATTIPPLSEKVCHTETTVLHSTKTLSIPESDGSVVNDPSQDSASSKNGISTTGRILVVAAPVAGATVCDTIAVNPSMNMATTQAAIVTAAAAAAVKPELSAPSTMTGEKRKISELENTNRLQLQCKESMSVPTDPTAAAAAAAVAALAAGVASSCQPKDPIFYEDDKKTEAAATPVPIPVGPPTILPAFTPGPVAVATDGIPIVVATIEQPEKKIRKRRAERDNHSEMWMKQFELLKAYKAENGHCLVPKIYPENQSFSTWVYKQRADYRQRQRNRHKGPMNDERLKKLNDIGFVFRAKSTKEQMEFERERRQPADNKKWDNFFLQLCAYKEKHGHAIVPKVCKENQPLSRWVFKQRAEYKLRTKDKPSRITDSQIEKLNSVEFAWEAKTNDEWRKYDLLRKQVMVDGVWNHHFNELCEFKEKNGHTIVPKVYPANQTLSTWVYRQRALYRRKEQGDEVNDLVKERFKKLEEVGFKFRVRNRKSASLAVESQVSNLPTTQVASTVMITPPTALKSEQISVQASQMASSDPFVVTTITTTTTTPENTTGTPMRVKSEPITNLASQMISPSTLDVDESTNITLPEDASAT